MTRRDDLRRYRDEIKGVAILLVVLMHMRLGLTGVAQQWQNQTEIGVDIFFFLSGFGLYHSLERAPELGGYVRRRLWRLLPAYLPLCVAWLAVMAPRYELCNTQILRTIAGNLLMIGYMTNVAYVVNWYVTGMVISLVCAPLFYGWLKNAKRPALALLLLLGAAGMAGVCFFTDYRITVVARFPIFIMGMGFAMKPKKEWSRAARLAAGLAAFLGGCALKWFCVTRYPTTLMDLGMAWYPYALITLPLCLALCRFFRGLEGRRKLFAPLRYLGRASFEIYLFNAWAELWCRDFVSPFTPLDSLWYTLGSIAAGCVYHAAVTACVARFRGAGAGRAKAVGAREGETGL